MTKNNYNKIISFSSFQKYTNEHNCSMNHDGSAPRMEMVGVKNIFNRSIEKNN